MVNALEDKKGEDILLLDIHEIASFTDYFVICTASSERMLDALADAVREHTKSAYEIHSTVEGKPGNGWLVIDLGDVVVHLLSQEKRNYYRIEELWNKGKILLRLQ